VAIPAIVITCLLDILSHELNPPFYDQHWGPYRYIVLHLISNLVFMSQNWGTDISPLSNSPFWSLSYEAWFYLIFGLFIARRFLWAVLASVLAGPNIMYLMLLWLMGVLSFDLVDRARTRRHVFSLFVSSAFISILLLAIFLQGSEQIASIFDGIQRAIFGTFNISPRRAREDLVVPGIIAAFVFTNFLTLAKLLEVGSTVPRYLVRLARLAGNFTFPLYLLHFPIFVLCGSIGFYDRRSWVQFILVLVGVCCAIGLITPLTSIFKNVLKGWLAQMKTHLDGGKVDFVRPRIGQDFAGE
jgi:peptidoglycan/LPS O-acetylase OafA/YrhL